MSELYPEHEKLRAVVDKSQVCGEFIEWLEGEGFFLEHNTHKHFVLRENLAKFFEIDEKKLEAEKLAMLEAQRKLNHRPHEARP